MVPSGDGELTLAWEGSPVADMIADTVALLALELVDNPEALEAAVQLRRRMNNELNNIE